jgi:hypothetical protein
MLSYFKRRKQRYYIRILNFLYKHRDSDQAFSIMVKELKPSKIENGDKINYQLDLLIKDDLVRLIEGVMMTDVDKKTIKSEKFISLTHKGYSFIKDFRHKDRAYYISIFALLLSVVTFLYNFNLITFQEKERLPPVIIERQCVDSSSFQHEYPKIR